MKLGNVVIKVTSLIENERNTIEDSQIQRPGIIKGLSRFSIANNNPDSLSRQRPLSELSHGSLGRRSVAMNQPVSILLGKHNQRTSLNLT